MTGHFRWWQLVFLSHTAVVLFARLFKRLKSTKLAVRIILALQTRIGDEELVVNTRIVVAHGDAAFEYRKRFTISSEPHEQSPQIVMGRIVFRFQRQRATQEVFSFRVLATLRRNESQVGQRRAVVWL